MTQLRPAEFEQIEADALQPLPADLARFDMIVAIAAFAIGVVVGLCLARWWGVLA